MSTRISAEGIVGRGRVWAKVGAWACGVAASFGVVGSAYGWAFTLNGNDRAALSVVAAPGIFDGLNDISADGRYAVGSTGGFGIFDGFVVDTTTGVHTIFNTIIGESPDQVNDNHDTEGRTIAGNGTVAFGLAEISNTQFLAASYPQAAAGGTGSPALLSVLGPGGSNQGDLPGGTVFGEPWGASMDGSVVVGRSTGGNGTEAFRWTPATGMVGLGDLPGGVFTSAAYAVSNDGTIIVGEGRSANTFEGFRWTQAGGMAGLGGSSNHANPASQAQGISGDGGVVVGNARFVPTSFNTQPGKWTPGDGWSDLGPLPAGEATTENNRRGFAFDASLDGSVIVGEISSTRTGQEAFVWTETAGMQTLWTILDNAGIDVDNWTFNSLRAISDDGRIVVGSATTPINSVEAYVAFLPDTLFATAQPGDFTGNGGVEQGDLDLVLTGWGGPRGSWSNADGFTTTDIDQEELDAVLTNWGDSNGPGFAGASVPEPAAMVVVLLGLVPLRRVR